MLQRPQRHTHATNRVEFGVRQGAVRQLTQAARRAPAADVPGIGNVAPLAVGGDVADIDEPAVEHGDLQAVLDASSGVAVGRGRKLRGQGAGLSNGQVVEVDHVDSPCRVQRPRRGYQGGYSALGRLGLGGGVVVAEEVALLPGDERSHVGGELVIVGGQVVAVAGQSRRGDRRTVGVGRSRRAAGRRGRNLGRRLYVSDAQRPRRLAEGVHDRRGNRHARALPVLGLWPQDGGQGLGVGLVQDHELAALLEAQARLGLLAALAAVHALHRHVGDGQHDGGLADHVASHILKQVCRIDVHNVDLLYSLEKHDQVLQHFVGYVAKGGALL